MAKKIKNIKCILFSQIERIESFQSEILESLVGLKFEVQLSLFPYHEERLSFQRGGINKDITSIILTNDLIIVDIESLNSTLFYQIGIARAIGKPIVLVGLNNNLFLQGIPESIRHSYFILYNDRKELISSFREFFIEFQKNPSRFSLKPIIESEVNSNISIDLEKLDQLQFENLCFELLTRLGYKQLEWKIKDEFIDAVSILEKKDPDGYEYDEFWLISFATRNQHEKLFDIAIHDPEYFAHRLFRDTFERTLFNPNTPRFNSDVPITLFFIFKDGVNKRFKELIGREYRIRNRKYPINIRIRWWDENNITNLVQNNYQLAKKYFSTETLKSNTRVSYEELYIENKEMYEQLLKSNEALISQKNRVESLERDAAWKLLSFTAAHRLGNPIDAIDSELQNLKSLLNIKNKDKIYEIISSIEVSVEKAKSIVNQFRNLSIAHEINPELVDFEKLNELLVNSAKYAKDTGVELNFKLDKLPNIEIDTQKLPECFVEIVKNALRHLSKKNGQISIETSKVKRTDLPDKVDKTKDYIKISISDNGCGVPIEKKKEIFKPFERTHVHGTGLGLAFCDVIIGKHGGLIQEVGKQNEGAIFEIYLPVKKK